MVRQKGTVPPVLDRLSLGVQHSLYPLDDVVSASQEEVEEFDVGLKLHRAHLYGSLTIRPVSGLCSSVGKAKNSSILPGSSTPCTA
jgi:hypothetical protein